MLSQLLEKKRGKNVVKDTICNKRKDTILINTYQESFNWTGYRPLPNSEQIPHLRVKHQKFNNFINYEMLTCR